MENSRWSPEESERRTRSVSTPRVKGRLKLFRGVYVGLPRSGDRTSHSEKRRTGPKRCRHSRQPKGPLRWTVSLDTLGLPTSSISRYSMDLVTPYPKEGERRRLFCRTLRKVFRGVFQDALGGQWRRRQLNYYTGTWRRGRKRERVTTVSEFIDKFMSETEGEVKTPLDPILLTLSTILIS